MNKMLGIVNANYSEKRLECLTAERSAASLPMGGRYRMVDFALSNMVNSGITTVGLITPHNSRSLLDHVGVGNAWNLSRKVGGLFILPGSAYGIKDPGSKFLLRDILRNRAIIDRADEDVVAVSAADWIGNVDFRDVLRRHVQTGADVTMLYKPGFREGRDDLYLKLEPSGEVSDILGDGTDCFIGAFLINRPLLLSFFGWYGDAAHFDMVGDILRENLHLMKVYGYEVRDYVGVVDTLEDYQAVNADFLRPEVRRQLLREDRPVYTKVQDSPPTRYAPGAGVSNSLISTGCTVAGTVEDSVIFRGVEIEAGAVVKNCVLLQHTHVGAGAILQNVVCDKNVTVLPGSRLVSRQRPMAIAKNQEI